MQKVLEGPQIGVAIDFEILESLRPLLRDGVERYWNELQHDEALCNALARANVLRFRDWPVFKSWTLFTGDPPGSFLSITDVAGITFVAGAGCIFRSSSAVVAQILAYAAYPKGIDPREFAGRHLLMAVIAGITFEAFREEWLADVRAGGPSTTELGHRFAAKLLTQWLDIDTSSEDLVYCDGAGDGGIDIAFLDRSDASDEDIEGMVAGDTWYVVQSKYGKAFQGTNTLLEEGQKIIDSLDGNRQRLSSLAEGLLERLLNFRRQATDRDRLILVFATELPLTEEQHRALRDIRAMGRERIGPLFDVEAVSIETIYQRTLETELLGPGERRVSIRGAMTRSGEDLLVGSVTLLDLFAFLKAYRDQTEDLDQIYEHNVRRFLGGRGRVNKAIQDTLRTNPERFGLFNNGITIVVKDFEVAEDGDTVLSDPYIVNGCQTTRSIWDVCYQRLEAGGHGSSPELEEWKTRAGKGVVVTKVARVGSDGDALERAITRFTNTQNAVREKDFLALTGDFRHWADQMGEKYDVYLETQRGGWESRKALQKQQPEQKQFKRYANAFDLLKVYGAGWMQEAGIAFGKNAPFLPNGSIFKRVMASAGSDGEEPYGVDDLYAAYRLQQTADDAHFGRGGQVTRRQTRYLYYLVVLDLLTDVMTRSGLNKNNSARTVALVAVLDSSNIAARDALVGSALEVVDTYMTQGLDESVFEEPAYKNVFNFDLNGFLKWEKLGKGEDNSPRLRSLLAVIKSSMGRMVGGQPSARQQIVQAISAQA
jgi:hypothetical protein